jgi:hypothetical protein
MEIRGTATFEDYRDRLRATTEPQWAGFSFGVLLLRTLLFEVFLIHRDLPAVGWPWVAAAAGLGICAYRVPRLQARRHFGRSAQGEIVWILDQTGTTSTSSRGRAELRWEAYSRYKETEGVFLLSVRSGGSLAIPKRVMSSEQVVVLRTPWNAQIRERTLKF